MKYKEQAAGSRQQAAKKTTLLLPIAHCPLPSNYSSLITHPSSLLSRRSVIVWAVTATVTLLFVSLIVVAPLAAARGDGSLALVIYVAFSKFCHQMRERSFELAGHPFAVCARCAGIYFGFAAGVLVYPLVRSLKRTDVPARWWLLVALVPTAADFALDFFGVLPNTHLSRTLTGALLGGVTAFFVVPGLIDLSRMSLRRASLKEELELLAMREREVASD